MPVASIERYQSLCFSHAFKGLSVGTHAANKDGTWKLQTAYNLGTCSCLDPTSPMRSIPLLPAHLCSIDVDNFRSIGTMILSPYQNPPYRTPTPKASSIRPPPVGPSPKRKRPSPVEITVPLQLDTSLALPPESPTDCDSPRTKVADSLYHLDLCQTSLAPSCETNAARRKRLKRNNHLQRNDDDVCSNSCDTIFLSQQSNGIYVADRRSESPVKVREMPDCRHMGELPSCFPSAPRKPELQAVMGACNAAAMDDSARSMTVPSSHSSSAGRVFNRPPSPMDIRDDMSVDQAALTWQDDEITGHDIDTTSVDDDGEGINGIGFKPTPAIAYARSQKRKQQVSEWRAREARDARQRRFERRRAGAGLEGSKKDSNSRRMVRFVGVA